MPLSTPSFLRAPFLRATTHALSRVIRHTQHNTPEMASPEALRILKDCQADVSNKASREREKVCGENSTAPALSAAPCLARVPTLRPRRAHARDGWAIGWWFDAYRNARKTGLPHLFFPHHPRAESRARLNPGVAPVSLTLFPLLPFPYRPASTAARKAPPGRPSRTASSCAWNARASTGAWACTCRSCGE